MSELFNKKLIFIFKYLSRCKTKTQLKTLKIKLITMANVCDKTMCLYDEDIEGQMDTTLILLKMWNEEDNEMVILFCIIFQIISQSFIKARKIL